MTKYSFLLVGGLALLPELLQAQATTSTPTSTTSRVYRCGNQYTNTPTEAQAPGCRPLEGVPLTVVQGVRPPPTAARPPAAPAQGDAQAPGAGPVASLRVDSAEQRARDADARAILEAELRKAQARQAELLREYNNGEPEKLGPETRNYQKYLDRVAHLKASIARTEADIEGLRRELSRLSASK